MGIPALSVSNSPNDSPGLRGLLLLPTKNLEIIYPKIVLSVIFQGPTLFDENAESDR
jgi:hypothetical protein